MVFLDEAIISVKSGRGGDGSASFRREKYVPHGGPDGGDGGHGGSVILEADENINTLIDFRSRRHYKADPGTQGLGKRKTGKNGEDIILKTPVGTLVYEVGRERPLYDLVLHGQRAVLAKGGRGGRGNCHFVSPIRQAPSFCEKGEPGESRELRFELKLLADVGLLGFPNVGKSTLISQISAARPKIADYPFTTLVPNLGVVQVEDESFVVADIPGIIEGASEGIGLGHQFLRHVERTRLLVHILDVSGVTGRNPAEDFRTLNHELAAYSDLLASLPQVIVLNKMDVTGAADVAAAVRLELPPDAPVFEMSAATGRGVREVVYHLAERLREIPKPLVAPEGAEETVFIGPPEPETWEVRREDDGAWVVEGKPVERLVEMTDLDREESVRKLHRQLKSRGVLDKLAADGAAQGDTVRIAGVEFDYVN
ncbi:MAG TPA: GTPase ObgE [Armatimonadota bacterium]|jgi:GTP-binding protein